MSLITASGLAVRYGAQDVFRDVSLAVDAGSRIALVGPNGCGKTSLLRILAGIDPPAAGSVHRAKGAGIAYLPQDPTFPDGRTLWEEAHRPFAALEDLGQRLRSLEAAMADAAAGAQAARLYEKLQVEYERQGGYDYEQRIRRALSGMGFTEDDYHRRLGEFSGGQRTRAMLARLILEEPEVLLLDEPTNHLDVEAMEWLESNLKTSSSAVVVVAHDRSFLDAVAAKVWELGPAGIDAYRGNYTAFAAQRAQRRDERRAAAERQRRDIERTEDYIRRNISGQNSRQARGRRTRLARVERLEAPRSRRKPDLRFRAGPRGGDRALALRGLVAGYSADVPLVQCDDVEVMRGARVAITGPNGVGKTALLRTIAGEIPPLAGQVQLGGGAVVGYFAQDHSGLTPGETALEHILAAGDMLPAQGRSFLARYGFGGDDAFKPVDALSGGERARVALAILSLRGANLLLLDEPTNHLDLDSQEVLQAALSGGDGTLLVVSHDRYLLRGLCDEVWAIEGGALERYSTGYDEYRAAVASRREEAKDTTKSSRAKGGPARRAGQKSRQREGRRLSARREAVEAAIEAKEAHLAGLMDALEAATSARDVERIAALGEEYAATEAAVADLLSEWEGLAAAEPRA